MYHKRESGQLSLFAFLCFALVFGLPSAEVVALAGLAFALTALFVVLFIEQLKGKQQRISGALGLVCTVVALAVFGADQMVIAAMVLILICLLAGRRKLCS